MVARGSRPYAAAQSGPWRRFPRHGDLKRQPFPDGEQGLGLQKEPFFAQVRDKNLVALSGRALIGSVNAGEEGAASTAAFVGHRLEDRCLLGRGTNPLRPLGGNDVPCVTLVADVGKGHSNRRTASRVVRVRAPCR